ncbi:MAG: hypothetical protein AAF927_25830 [Bacteroidota bacterium]
MYSRADHHLAQILIANGLTEVSDRFDDGRREFRLKANGKRYIRLQNGIISDNVAELSESRLDESQLKLLIALHVMHPISRKELLRNCGTNLAQMQKFVETLEYGVCAGNTCHKLSGNVLDTLQAILLPQPLEAV